MSTQELKQKLTTERESLLQILLDILNSAADYGVGPHAKNFGPTDASETCVDFSKHVRRRKM